MALLVSGSVARADGPLPDLSIAAIQAQLRELSGAGWGANGPGGECKPSMAVNCLDGATIRVLVKEIASSVAGHEVTEPEILALIDKFDGARTEVRGTFLEFSLYLTSDYTYVKPTSSTPSKVPLKQITLPQTLRLNIFSNGGQGTLNLKKPVTKWRSRSLKVVTTLAPVEVYLEQIEVNLVNSTIALKVGLSDIVSIWAGGSFSSMDIQLNGKKTVLSNLAALIIAPWIFI